MADTRKDKRAPVSLKVRFKSATLDEFVEQYSGDISRGGIFIKSKKPMKVGTLLKFEFQLKDQSRLIHGVGRVVWHREPGDNDGAPGMGIKFIKMDGDSRTLVQDIVSQRGEGPGTFDEGADGPKEPSFFPEGGPATLPDPEDRTSVRHASEFLAEALAEAGEGSAAEAQADADAARKRTEEIQRERDAADIARRQDEEEAGQRATDQARRSAEAKAAASDPEPSPSQPAEKAPALAAPTPEPAHAKAPEQKRTPSLKPAPDERASRPSVEPEEEPGGGGMIIAFILLIAAGVGGYFIWNNMQGEEVADPVQDPVEDPIQDPIVDPVAEPDVTTVAVRIVSEPEGAEVRINGAPSGFTPLDAELPQNQEVELVVHLEGHATITQTYTAAGTEGEESAFDLQQLTYVIDVQSEPAGARVRVGNRTITTPSEVRLDSWDGRLILTGTKRGFGPATMTLEGTEFSEVDGAMRYTARLVLPRAATMVVRMTMQTATMETMETMETAETMETETMETETMETETMETTETETMEAPPVMEATMDATMETAPPDNPF